MEAKNATPPKTNMDTVPQNDAIFERRYSTLKKQKTSFLVSMLDFGGFMIYEKVWLLLDHSIDFRDTILNLLGGFNPSEKYARQMGFIFPNFRGENSKKNL